MNDADKERVSAALCDIESRHGCRVLFAVESGSRAWGFASPDSDYDVRGVFVKPLDWYLQLKSDVPDTIVEELPGDIDVSLWDLRKALLQMAKSNASFLEWLGSPIIYRDCGIVAALNELKADCVNPACCISLRIDVPQGDGSAKRGRYDTHQEALLRAPRRSLLEIRDGCRENAAYAVRRCACRNGTGTRRADCDT